MHQRILIKQAPFESSLDAVSIDTVVEEIQGSQVVICAYSAIFCCGFDLSMFYELHVATAGFCFCEGSGFATGGGSQAAVSFRSG